MKKLICLVMLVGLLAISGTALANPAHKELLKLSDVERANTFAVVVNDVGHACNAGGYTFHQGSYKEFEYWNLSCKDGNTYIIKVMPDGMAKAIPCSVGEDAGIPCFQRMD